MHVLMLSDVYFPRVNGVSTSIRTFVRSLLELGHRVTLVAPDYGSGDAQDAFDSEFGSGFEVIRLPARTIFFDPEDRLITARALRDAFAQLARRDWDVVHVHTPFRAHTSVCGARVRGCGWRPHTYFEEYAAHYLPWLPAAAGSTARASPGQRRCRPSSSPPADGGVLQLRHRHAPPCCPPASTWRPGGGTAFATRTASNPIVRADRQPPRVERTSVPVRCAPVADFRTAVPGRRRRPDAAA
jgi:hypothetical protein